MFNFDISFAASSIFWSRWFTMPVNCKFLNSSFWINFPSFCVFALLLTISSSFCVIKESFSALALSRLSLSALICSTSPISSSIFESSSSFSNFNLSSSAVILPFFSLNLELSLMCLTSSISNFRTCSVSKVFCFALKSRSAVKLSTAFCKVSLSVCNSNFFCSLIFFISSKPLFRPSSCLLMAIIVFSNSITFSSSFSFSSWRIWFSVNILFFSFWYAISFPFFCSLSCSSRVRILRKSSARAFFVSSNIFRSFWIFSFSFLTKIRVSSKPFDSFFFSLSSFSRLVFSVVSAFTTSLRLLLVLFISKFFFSVSSSCP